MASLFTIGHGRLDRDALLALLSAASIDSVIDIRRFPASRHNPDVNREALEQWLPAAGVAYRWDERMGGRRRLSKGVLGPDQWWTVEAFRAYAAHTRTAEFRDAFAELNGEALARRVAMMCSESVWWRCHRRLVADVAAVGHGFEVCHLMHDGRVREHHPAAGARADADGLVVWDGRRPEP